MADLIQFPRANSRADRAFWIGPDKPAVETVPEQFRFADTAPAEYCAPDWDCA